MTHSLKGEGWTHKTQSLGAEAPSLVLWLHPFFCQRRKGNSAELPHKPPCPATSQAWRGAGLGERPGQGVSTRLGR